ncbi:MAG: DNA glycosylase, partial [Candidatus Woesearchaeota archaeon]
EKSKLYLHNISRKNLIKFFRLHDDLLKIFKQIDKDKNIHQAITKYRGLRLIKQDPWQCIVSFICSSNSNILRIKKNINSVCERFGERIEMDRKVFYTFPSSDKILSDKKKLMQCGLGYRCSYLYETAKVADKVFIKRLEKANYETAKGCLLNLRGVGDKVAECILLFSLNHNNAFPVDTWIKKGMLELYGNEIKRLNKSKNISEKSIREFAQLYFGSYAGYAQQYLFHWRRHHV